MDVEAWLRRLGLEQYAGAFAEHDIDAETLVKLTGEDLKEIGVTSVGHRRKLLDAIAHLDSYTAETVALDGALAGAPEAERRQLTLMFCDLAGSTALAERLDPEEMRGIIRSYQNAVSEEITRFDGHVAKFMGDGVLAYFGWPQAHEDDAERAVRSGLGVTQASGRLTTPGGEPLAVRVGIATGLVVVGDLIGEGSAFEESVVGTTPNLAARLQGLAEPGQVVINEGTRRLIGGGFELDDGAGYRLKGFSDPVVVWRVTGASQTASRFEALHGTRLTEFVGREHEIGLLRARLAQARGGEGQVMLMFGEAGIGKSRILHEFTASLSRETSRVLRYQCSAHAINAAFHPIVSEIEATAGLLPDKPPAQRLDVLERHLAAIFDNAAAAAPLFASLFALPLDRYPPIDMSPQRRKHRTITLLIERIARLSCARPVVLLFEDIHWIDPSSRETLDALVERVRELPVLAVMTYRPEFVPPWVGDGHVTVHSLNRLGHSQGQAIAQRVAGSKALPPEVLDHIVEQTDGVPLFIEELTKTVLETGFLEEHADRYVLTGPLPSLAIPTTLQDSLMARLDRLAPVKGVIQAAACIGREFDVGLLGTALPMSSDELDGALDQLVAAQLVFRRGDAEGARCIFKHALVQDAAYRSLLTSTRRDLHKRLARALERTDKSDPLALARHHAEAGGNTRAAELYLEAGHRLLADSAVPEAIGALESGFKAMEAMPPAAERDRFELEIRAALGAARAVLWGWSHQSVLDAVKPAYNLANTLEDHELLGATFWLAASHFASRAKIRSLVDWVHGFESIAVAEENAETDLPILFHLAASHQLFWMGQFDKAVAHVEELERLYAPERHARIVRLINQDPISQAQNYPGSLGEWIRGYPDRARERMDRAVRRARKVRHPFDRVFILTHGATCLIYLDQADRLIEQCDEAQEVARDEALGPFAEHVCIGQWRGAALIQRGEFERGYALAKEGRAFWHRTGGRLCDAQIKCCMVTALQSLGRTEEALHLNAQAIAHCRDTGDRYMEAECLRQKGELTLAIRPSDVEAAERLIREAVAIAQAQRAKSWELRGAMSLARLLRSLDRRADAAACLEPVLNWFTEGFDTADLKAAKALLEDLG